MRFEKWSTPIVLAALLPLPIVSAVLSDYEMIAVLLCLAHAGVLGFTIGVRLVRLP